MRTSLYALTAAAALAAASAMLGAAPAQAAGNLPFCLNGGMTYGINDCSYPTMEACRATASGNAGSCLVNPQYQARSAVYGADEALPPPPPRKRRPAQ